MKKKRSFTGPFWFMIILGMIAVALPCYLLWGSPLFDQTTLSVGLLQKMRLFLMAVIMFLEASMYWMVRKRNIYRRASWTHVLLFALAYVTPFIKELLFIFYDAFSPAMEMRRYILTVDIAQVCIFWGVMIIAHIIFARLLLRLFSKKQPEEQEGASTEHLLDDVLT